LKKDEETEFNSSLIFENSTTNMAQKVFEIEEKA
jgi:hypothetical protein